MDLIEVVLELPSHTVCTHESSDKYSTKTECYIYHKTLTKCCVFTNEAAIFKYYKVASNS